MQAHVAAARKKPQRKTRTALALERAIEEAFFAPGSAAHIATAFSTGSRRLHAGDVQRIWRAAKAAGRLPPLQRPKRGPSA